MPAEVLKIEAEEFGGWQRDRLTSEQIQLRYCCARFCSDRGKVQLPMSGGFRVACGRHAALALMMVLGILGDPSPVGEVRAYAESLGVDWDKLLASEPIHPTTPEHFRCLRCGGGYHVETIGMYTGKRYIHNCGS